MFEIDIEQCPQVRWHLEDHRRHRAPVIAKILTHLGLSAPGHRPEQRQGLD